MATYKQGSSFSQRVESVINSTTWPLSCLPDCRGKTEHLKVEETMKAVSLKLCLCSEIKPPKSRQGGNESTMAMQLLELLNRMSASLSAQT